MTIGNLKYASLNKDISLADYYDQCMLDPHDLAFKHTDFHEVIRILERRAAEDFLIRDFVALLRSIFNMMSDCANDAKDTPTSKSVRRVVDMVLEAVLAHEPTEDMATMLTELSYVLKRSQLSFKKKIPRTTFTVPHVK